MEPYVQPVVAATLQLVRSARITNALQAVSSSHAICSAYLLLNLLHL
jgi:hypothetical protein